MPFHPTKLPGLVVFEPAIFEDSRGFFYEAYNRRRFADYGIKDEFLQDNQSFSRYGVIRGLHYQLDPHAQSKLVRVLKGKILDVAVDIRKGSPTYGHHVAMELSDENHLQLYLPAGFAHGFSVLSETAQVLYKCDAYYNKESEGGIAYNDPQLAIDWKIPAGSAVVSEKDLALPAFMNCRNNFVFET